MDYPGKVITKTQVTPTQTSASGNWTLDDQAAAIKNNNWPVALVPNPISKSLRFNSADSAYLNRTPASAGNRTTWTWSGWVKRGGITLSSNTPFFSAGTSSSEFSMFYVSSTTDRLVFYTLSGGVDYGFQTSAVLRDPSAWYHLMCVYDSTNGTAANRLKLYINGVQYTDKATDYGDIPLNHQTFVNATNEHLTGKYTGNTQYLDGYMTEINFIDGQALTPSDFGLTNPQTGQWIPKKYTGTYGTNGFYLNFKDATSTTTLGYDYSGNANNWTTNNFSVTAGVNNDSFTDVPTPWVAYNTTGDVGGVVRSNYATFNPLFRHPGTTWVTTYSEGNLKSSTSNAGSSGAISTIGPTSGKWYCEITCTAVGSATPFVDISTTNSPDQMNTSGEYLPGNYSYGVYYNSAGTRRTNNTATASWGSTWTTNDVLMLAGDCDTGKVWFGKNGTWQASGNPASGTNQAATLTTATPMWFGCGAVSGAAFVANFGQRPFAYTPPAGFRSLCTTNLPATTIGFGLTNQGDDYFNAVLYSGNGTSQTIDTGLQPDFIWIKRRNGAAAHTLTDSVRGTSKQLFTNLTDAEQTDADSGVTAIGSSSMTLGDNNLAVGSVNGSGSTYVAWNWKANGSGSSNTAGTITSTVSANTTAGFSVVTYTGTGVAATVGHGLGVAPSMIIVKDRDDAGTNWCVYHVSLGNGNRVLLNLTNASAATGNWNSTSPTSSVFSIGVSSEVSANNKQHVAYCFAAVAGYSAFGSYTGNGSTDGPFVYLGFRPRFLLLKISSTTGDWAIYDTSRNTYNVMDLYLYPNSSAAEGGSGTPRVDALSNGFKLRNLGQDNTSSATYIYAAFAEFPFQFANAR